MIESVPTNTRVLAPSLRGYTGSSPFSEQDSSPEQLRTRIGQDLASIVAAYIEQLSLLSNAGSKVRLFTWSLGVCSLLSAYTLLAEGKLMPECEVVISEKVSDIIIFEAPATVGFGRPASASTREQQSVINTLTPGGQFIASMRQVTGIYEYPQGILDDVVKGVPVMDVVFQPGSSLADDDAFMAIITPIMEPAPMSYYVKARTTESEEGTEYARAALRAMIKAPGVKKVRVLTTKHTVPDCLEGSAVLVGDLTKLEPETQSKKMKLCFVEGKCNHFALVQEPKALWAAIKS
jgi:pimeloyl-ACP methyl ester carboxylesterase